jgi:acyl carrier protein
MPDLELLKEIINSIKENNNAVKLDNINAGTNLRDNLSFDSLDLAEFTVRIEQKFGIDIFENGIVLTVGEVLDKIKGKNGE